MSDIPMRNVSLDEFVRIVSGTTIRDLESVVVEAAIKYREDLGIAPLIDAIDALVKAREESK